MMSNKKYDPLVHPEGLKWCFEKWKVTTTWKYFYAPKFGCSLRFSDLYNISISTFYRWLKIHPEFAEKIKEIQK